MVALWESASGDHSGAGLGLGSPGRSRRTVDGRSGVADDHLVPAGEDLSVAGITSGEHPPETRQKEASRSRKEGHESRRLPTSLRLETPEIARRMSPRHPQAEGENLGVARTARGEHPSESGQNEASQSREEWHERSALPIVPPPETPEKAGRMSVQAPSGGQIRGRWPRSTESRSVLPYRLGVSVERKITVELGREQFDCRPVGIMPDSSLAAVR